MNAYNPKERNNINRGFRKLRVWQDAIQLYALSVRIYQNISYKYNKSVANTLDSCHSISRNIAEGYCRKGIREYLNFLNISLGSSGEFHSSNMAFKVAGLLSEEDFEQLDLLHFKVENQLIKLIESLQKKEKNNDWNTSFIDKE